MFCILMVNTTLFAQESEKSGRTHEIGINATFFIQQFISFGTSSNVNVSPYAITYRRIKSNRGIFRAGFGMNGTTTTIEVDGTTISESHSFVVDTRFGIERQFNIGKHWSTSLGGDLRSQFREAKTSNPQFGENFVAIDKTISNGIGPVLGIRFDINEKMGLYTETAFLAELAFGKSITEFGMGVDSDESKQTVFSSQFSLPTSIYFIIKFNK